MNSDGPEVKEKTIADETLPTEEEKRYMGKYGKQMPRNITFPKTGMTLTLLDKQFRVLNSDPLKGRFVAQEIK